MSPWLGHLDWRDVHGDVRPAAADPRLRLRLLSVGFAVLASIVFARLVQLELRDGERYRAIAAAPLERERPIPGIRGRILGRDGTVLAVDEPVAALAVHYRYLETPPDAAWLRSQARSRLSSVERRDRQRVAQAEAEVLRARDELHHQLPTLSGIAVDDWTRRIALVQRRVESISRSVNRRQQERAARSTAETALSDEPTNQISRIEQAVRSWFNPRPPSGSRRATAEIVVAEELDYHVVAEGLPVNVVAEIEQRPQHYRGVRVEIRRRRSYPRGASAPHVIGYLGDSGRVAPVPANELHEETEKLGNQALVGVMGVERAYERFLRGAGGVEVELTDHSGSVLSTSRRQEPAIGRDLILTLDLELQKTAEELLDSSAVRRLSLSEGDAHDSGGAIVVLNVHSGAILASASFPRFDSRDFSRSNTSRAVTLLADPANPLFDRACRMAIPPGSVFKALTAVAMLESGMSPSASIDCRGYLDQPDRQRCMIFARYGLSHGEVSLSDALAQSCNVYFFHAAGELGPGPLVDWSRRFGFGRPTGVDLPDEASGRIPTAEANRSIHGRAIAQAQAMAIGQGTLLATPLQIARMLAAIANGGRLVTPHVASALGLPGQDAATSADPESESLAEGWLDAVPPRQIDGLSPRALAAVREGLERVVADPEGTGHGTVYLASVPVAGKTGTAETGDGRGDHAWFAGYAPANAPRVAFAIALEHAGSGSSEAGPIARRLVERMQQLGYFRQASKP